LAAVLAVACFCAHAAAAAPGSLAVAPSTAVAGSPGNTFTFTYTAPAQKLHGIMLLTVPAGFTAPQNASPSAPGYVDDVKDSCPANVLGTFGRKVAVHLSCKAGTSFQLRFSGVTAPPAAGVYPFAAVITDPNDFAWTPSSPPPASLQTLVSPTVTVVAAPATSLTLSAPGGNAVNAGQAFSLRVTARDAFGNTATGYAGTVHFAGAAGTLPADYAFTAADAGVHTFGGVVLTALGTQTVTATDTARPALTSSLALTVSPGPLDHFVLSFVPNATAGQPFAFTATAKDSAGNTITAYNAPATWNDGTGTLAPAAPSAFAGGVSTTLARVTRASAADTITFTSGGVSATSNAFSVAPGALAQIDVAPIANTNAGQTFSVAATAKDAFGNTVTDYNAAATWSDLSGTLAPAAPGAFVGGVSTTTGASVTTAHAGDTITISTGGVSGTSNAFDVAAGALDHFSIAAVSNVAAGQLFTFQAIARDSFGNTLTGYNAAATWSDATGTLEPAAPSAFVNGFSTTVNARLTRAHAGDTITISSGGVSSTSNAFDVTAGAPSRIVVAPLADATAGVPFTVQATMKDAFDNDVTAYNAAATWSDLTGTLEPAPPSAFVSGVSTTVTARLTKARSADTITISSGGVSATSNAFDVSPAAVNYFQLAPVANTTAGALFTVTATAKDAFDNVVTSYNAAATWSDLTGTLEPAAPSAFVSGVSTTATARLTAVRTGDTITISSGGVSATSNAFDVAPGPLNHLLVAPVASVVEDTPFSVQATALDAFGNVLTAYNAAATWSDLTGTLTPAAPGAFVNGVSTTPNAAVANPLAADTITITTGGVSATSNTFSVLPSAPTGPLVLLVKSGSDAVTTAGAAAVQAASPYPVTVVDTSSLGLQFTPAYLAAYRSVVFLGTGSALALSGSERSAFEAYFHAGGGFVGIGSAIDSEQSWQFLTDILGTRATGVTSVQSGTVKVYDRIHDATKNLPEYWDRTDAFYNFAANVRGTAHVLATVVEDPFGPQPQGQVLDGISGGTMGADHPVSWCHDYRGGRAFYTSLGNTAASFDAELQSHLAGALRWSSGLSDPRYSDCGATVTSNYRQVKVVANPNLNEPIGFDQLPDGRLIQTARTGTVWLHDPATGTTEVIADFGSASLPTTQRVYTTNEDGLYGPAVDNNFATNHWVYLYYAPQTVQDVKLSDGSIVTQTTPNTTVPNSATSLSAWDPYIGYFQLSRFKFVDAAPGAPAHLDLGSEQQILRVSNNRQECCHVGGDIDFDKNNNLWLVTGDDTPSAGIRANGYGPFEDELLDEQQTVRVTNATGGTFTLTFNGQTTTPLAFNSTAAQIDTALQALSNVGADNIQTSGGPINTATVNVFFRRALGQANQAPLTADASGLTGSSSPAVTTATVAVGGSFQRPTADSRRSALNTNDLRGKLLKIHVKDGDIGPADANKADFGSGGAYTIPAGNLYPLVAGGPQVKTRPEVYAMGFRNPFRLQVDENGVAYVSDYSPDAQSPTRSRGPSGVGRFAIVRHPANYGYPICYSSTLGYYRWNFQEFIPGTSTVGIPLDTPPQPFACGASSITNDSRWNLTGGPGNEPGLAQVPPVTDSEIWYSYRDNNTTAPLGTPCFAQYATTPGPIAPGSTTECPRLFPELWVNGVGPHGMTKYHYDPANPSPYKFPPYYDNSVILGEFTQDSLREVKLDVQNRVLKINSFLPCGQANLANPTQPFECDNPMDMQFGADGSFYLLTYGDGFFNVNPDAGLYRWEYVKGTRAPVAAAAADVTNGALPLTVSFSSAGSNTPEISEAITFDWNFGDGTPHSSDPDPTHDYTTPGLRTATLTVTASSGKTATASVQITAGNSAPTVVVTTPVLGGLFAFGNSIPFSVTVTDAEDGAINCSEVQVTFVLGHDTHGHAEAGTTGCTGVLATDASDVAHGGNVFGVISASYTDHGASGQPALTSVGQTTIRQKHQEVEFVVNQSGTNTATNTDGGAGVHRGSLADGDWIQLNGPYNLLNVNTIAFRVADGTAGRTAGSPLAAIEVHQDAVNGPIVQTDTLTSTGGTAVWSTQTFPVALSGTHELFLVFRAVTGGATGGNLFLLNWAEFFGPGVGS
jgi:hypothetical protein